MSPSGELVGLAPVPPTAPLSASGATFGPNLTPVQRLSVYDSGEWEEFIMEWVRSFGNRYVEVAKFAGANDGGIDIAGLRSPSRLAGEWDCFQCKHYANSLQPNQIWGEVLKLFIGVVDGKFTVPLNYFFVAPRGVGPTLSNFLNNSAIFRTGFLDWFDGDDSPSVDLGESVRPRVRALVTSTDFSLFKSVQLVDLLEQHRTTPYFNGRFGGALPVRQPSDPAPDEVQSTESRYLEQLVQVYAEHFDGVTSQEEAFAHAQAGRHLRRQREAFFSAESLKGYARDSVPPGTYESLQNELFESVVETHERPFPHGMERLTAVLESAVQAQITRNVLIGVSDPVDRRGICHQLANDDRLTWVQED